MVQKLSAEFDEIFEERIKAFQEREKKILREEIEEYFTEFKGNRNFDELSFELVEKDMMAKKDQLLSKY